MSTRLLVIDDEESICEILKYNLEKEGYHVDMAFSAEEALEMDLTPYDLFIVDIMMERLSGFDFAKRLRNSSTTEETPIIFCSALNGEDDTVMGLNIGADDYITKPFNLLELKARVRALLRRSGAAEQKKAEAVLTAGHIRLDAAARAAWRDGAPVELTAKEFDLMELLLRNPGRVYSRENLLNVVWGYEYIGDYRTVDVHVRRLREKLELDPASPEFIRTKWGVGYYLAKL